MRPNADHLGFVHQYVPGRAGQETTLLLLHGTGGDEYSMQEVGEMLAPRAGRLSPRGKVLEGDMPRFFRRLSEGVFDQEDLEVRTHELADFVQAAANEYGFDPKQVIAVGYSNGANIAASLLLRRPETLCAAVLFHPQLPFEPETHPDLSGVPIFLGAGRHDHLVPVANTERLATLLRESGADVTLYWQGGGHALSDSELDAAREWLSER
jgi:predicted esterase